MFFRNNATLNFTWDLDEPKNFNRTNLVLSTRRLTHHHVSMTVVNTWNNLLEKRPSFSFRQLMSKDIDWNEDFMFFETDFALFDDVVKQFTAGNIFHDHEYVGWCTDHLIPKSNKLIGRWRFCWLLNYSLMMCGCRKRRKFCISRRIFPTTSNCLIFVRLTIFMATVCLVNWWYASKQSKSIGNPNSFFRNENQYRRNPYFLLCQNCLYPMFRWECNGRYE